MCLIYQETFFKEKKILLLLHNYHTLPSPCSRVQFVALDGRYYLNSSPFATSTLCVFTFPSTSFTHVFCLFPTDAPFLPAYLRLLSGVTSVCSIFSLQIAVLSTSNFSVVSDVLSNYLPKCVSKLINTSL